MKQLIVLFCVLVGASAFQLPNRIVSGTITDQNGQALAGAFVTVRGTANGMLTGSDGKFRLRTGPSRKAFLKISMPGYLSREILIRFGSGLVIQLSQDTAAAMQGAVKKDSLAKEKYHYEVAMATAQLNARKVGSPMIGRLFYGPESQQLSAPPPFNREGYDHIEESGFKKVTDHPLSTFSIDVDAASYSNVRRILNEGRMPEQGAVRIEEMINYFSYDYAPPVNNDPFAIHMELGPCPWNSSHQLALIGMQAKKIDVSELPPSNLTFLVDVSGSMMSPDKLPLVQQSLNLLTDQLRSIDRVSLVVYAGNTGLVLPPTSGDRKTAIKEAINRLEAGGSTAGGMGIMLAYKTARENFIRKGNNRVILCTDGDFNVGMSSDDALENLIEEERRSGVFLTVLGFGRGNYQDAKMQKLADKGNGNHAYIDQLGEAKKVLVSEFGGTLFTVAKDVKLQVEFNPALVAGYRLVGYEKRMLNDEDFNNDRKDAGELGSGHTVTALYEIVPRGVPMPAESNIDPLRYQKPAKAQQKGRSDEELLFVKARYKEPDGNESRLLSFALRNKSENVMLSDNFRFAAAVAGFGMLLRNSTYKGTADYASVRAQALQALGNDREGYRKEFISLVDKAQRQGLVRSGSIVE